MDTPTIVDGKEYIPSKRAATLSGYTQDYIGQLARAGVIDARRIGGLWHVNLASVQEHKAKADTYVPVPPGRQDTQQSSTDHVISLDGKAYVSSVRAAAVTGYNQDYVTQLAREGKVISRQIGNRWYVAQDGILAHKREKDGLLAAVQAESVGLGRKDVSEAIKEPAHKEEEHPFYTYSQDARPLMPRVAESAPSISANPVLHEEDRKSPIPIRIHNDGAWKAMPHEEKLTVSNRYFEPIQGHSKKESRSRVLGPLAVTTLVALTVVAVVGVGMQRFSWDGLLTMTNPSNIIHQESLLASVSSAIETFGSILENIFTTPEIYTR